MPRARAIDTPSTAPDFVSALQTGTGSSQDITHNFGSVPYATVIVPQGGHNGSAAAGTQFPTITPGAHTSTVVKATVSAGATFIVLCWRSKGKQA